MMTKKQELELLKRYEPNLKFTKGELFFPTDAEDYLRQCSLWSYQPGLGSKKIFERGEIDFDTLGQNPPQNFGSVQYLKFTDPLKVAQYARYRFGKLRRSERKKTFHAGPGRLARVGYSARILDALFSLSLLTRGRVSGDQAAASAIRYREMQGEKERFQYYGRVVEDEDWTVLQYWFFYVYNDWRSGYFGLNDHEGDWEQVSVYLFKNDVGDWEPEWLAYASHDFEGDNLRRHWNDSQVEKVGEHPVVYIGAGSHASFFEPGEYLTELILPPLSPLMKRLRQISSGLRRLFGVENRPGQDEGYRIFSVPFIDYARGDGRKIGKGQQSKWAKPNLIGEGTPWVSAYRGLWGWWAKDPVMSENAPAGPMYDRFGSVRKAWYDPLGWAGMNKVSPQIKLSDRSEQRIEAIRARRKEAETQLTTKEIELKNLSLEAQAMDLRPHLQEHYRRHSQQIARLEEEIGTEKAKIAEDRALEEALIRYGGELEEGYQGQVRAHLQNPQIPDRQLGLRFRWLAEAWSAVSIGLAIIAFVAIALFAEQFLLFGALILMSVILVIEATFQGRMMGLANWLTGFLALVASIILLTEFFTPLVIGFVLLAGGYLIFDNLREIWS
jgi:hypothetical protein